MVKRFVTLIALLPLLAACSASGEDEAQEITCPNPGEEFNAEADRCENAEQRAEAVQDGVDYTLEPQQAGIQSGWMDPSVREGVDFMIESGSYTADVAAARREAPALPLFLGIKPGMLRDEVYAALARNEFQPEEFPGKSWKEAAYGAALFKLRDDVPRLAQSGELHFDNANTFIRSRINRFYGFEDERPLSTSYKGPAPTVQSTNLKGVGSREGDEISLEFAPTPMGDILAGFRYETAPTSESRVLQVAAEATGPLRAQASELLLSGAKIEFNDTLSSGHFAIVEKTEDGHDPATGEIRSKHQLVLNFSNYEYHERLERLSGSLGINHFYTFLLKVAKNAGPT